MLNKFSVRGRLILLCSVTLTALIVTGILSIFNLKSMNIQTDHVYVGGVEQLDPLNEIMVQISWNIQTSLQGAALGTISSSQALEKIMESKAKIQDLWNRYLVDDTFIDSSLKTDWNRTVEQYRLQLPNFEDFFRKTKDVLQQNKKEEVQSILKNDFYSTFQPAISLLEKLFSILVKDSKSDYIEAQQNYQKYVIFITFCFLLSFALSLILAYMVIRSIVDPLKYVVENVDRISKGDSSMDIQMVAGGELGQVLESVKNMIASSKKMSVVLAEFAAGDLSQQISARSENDLLGISLTKMSVQMRAMIGNIKEEVNALTSTSQEILSSVSQLASGTTESAAAVSETTTTLEELKQTSMVSSEKAKDVLVNADKTLLTVQASEKSVQAVIQNMDQIKDRMQIISESILKLSEKSLAIAEIMDSVNDIAEQSNLLAVNAAIEAAKAGEQGRSFSVVAEEIRTLAEQSKGATIQVRSLLNDIQNATNAAVLATEQGSKAVAKGVEQSTQTTHAINELAENMQQVTQSANQIVLSNQQQCIGTEQISLAMSNINEATQQHVDRLKEIETAVSGLNKVSSSLKELTDEYKLSREEDLELIHAAKIPHLIDKLQKRENKTARYEHSMS